MVYRTMEEWNKKGRKVKKGEKALVFCPVENKALFNKQQTERYKKRYTTPFWEDYDDCYGYEGEDCWGDRDYGFLDDFGH